MSARPISPEDSPMTRDYRLLLDHLKKFPISATGGLMLTKYVPLISSFSH